MEPQTEHTSAPRSGAWRDLAAILIRPRRTMARILERPRDLAVIPLVLLAVVSGGIGDIGGGEGPSLPQGEGVVLLMVAGIVIGIAILFTALFYLFSLLVDLAAGVLGGSGSVRRVRSALAWSLVPSIWALIYRVPVAVATERSNRSVELSDGWVLSVGSGVDGCGMMLLFAVLEILVFVWTVCLAVSNVSQATRMSAGRSLGALLMALAFPIGLLIVSLPLLK